MMTPPLPSPFGGSGLAGQASGALRYAESSGPSPSPKIPIVEKSDQKVVQEN